MKLVHDLDRQRKGFKGGKRRSAETRAKMSAAIKRAWADPAVRAKMSAASKRAWAEREEKEMQRSHAAAAILDAIPEDPYALLPRKRKAA